MFSNTTLDLLWDWENEMLSCLISCDEPENRGGAREVTAIEITTLGTWLVSPIDRQITACDTERSTIAVNRDT